MAAFDDVCMHNNIQHKKLQELDIWEKKYVKQLVYIYILVDWILMNLEIS